MRKHFLVIEVSEIEAAIIGFIQACYREWHKQTSEQEVKPILLSGLVQGMVVVLEQTLYASGYSLKTYWQSYNGRLLKEALDNFYVKCRRQFLYQPIDPARFN